MKALVQRVTRAEVRVAGTVVGRIGPGLLLFIGVERGDDEESARRAADKTALLRIFPDAQSRMNRSVGDIRGEILVVSQFTLAGSTARGRRPSFDRAAPPEEARQLYEVVVERLRSRGLTVATGEFRAMMEVELVNDGPVTFMLDLDDREDQP